MITGQGQWQCPLVGKVTVGLASQLCYIVAFVSCERINWLYLKFYVSNLGYISLKSSIVLRYNIIKLTYLLHPPTGSVASEMETSLYSTGGGWHTFYTEENKDKSVSTFIDKPQWAAEQDCQEYSGKTGKVNDVEYIVRHELQQHEHNISMMNYAASWT